MIEFYEYEQLLKATDGFSASTLIGKGSHGCVYKAILPDYTVVAVKKPLVKDHNTNLDNEARLLSSLPHSPLVVQFLGTTVDPMNNKLVVMEFMPNGSLHHLLLPSRPPLPWPTRLRIITQIARALHFLHQTKPPVIHRDIKAENILFDSHWNLKLADFGLAVAHNNNSLTQPAGTIGYLDPCYTTPTKLSTKSDVFSFGVLVLEIISGTKAIDLSRSPASITDWAIPLIEGQSFQQIYDTRIAIPKYLEGRTRKLLDRAARCVSPEQGKRPSMAEIVKAMESIERVKYPVWSSLMKSVVLMRRRRRLGKRWKLIKCWTTTPQPEEGDRKLLLREVLFSP